MDLKNRIPKALLDKKSILQLGNSGVLNEQITPLTPKLFEEQFDRINSILDENSEKNQKEFKDASIDTLWKVSKDLLEGYLQKKIQGLLN